MNLIQLLQALNEAKLVGTDWQLKLKGYSCSITSNSDKIPITFQTKDGILLLTATLSESQLNQNVLNYLEEYSKWI